MQPFPGLFPAPTANQLTTLIDSSVELQLPTGHAEHTGGDFVYAAISWNFPSTLSQPVNYTQ